ncbi:hypothetical protein P691DRAFT_783793 [Macrolepiota fuliginosa MF-IS2]|uniref:Uncharacterized protein n=1 Tax=Macrolepiota fuliginosa MF-IS2 TaxID=1400762 RepID=A0A9P5X8A3_9AGAR|nr:hypothetical protein P691DRAFT_783793 [Macrolepiota fuliginosa MF-IS2]
MSPYVRKDCTAHWQFPGELSLVERVELFWNTDWEEQLKSAGTDKAGGDSKTEGIKRLKDNALERLIKDISEHLPISGFKTKNDQVLCLDAIKRYIISQNTGAIELVRLVQRGLPFDELHIRLLSFSTVKPEDKIFKEKDALIIKPQRVAASLLSRLESDPRKFFGKPLQLPTVDQYSIFTELMKRFLLFFHQSVRIHYQSLSPLGAYPTQPQSEQVAVMKVAAYNLLLQYANPQLCSRFYPELNLFNLTARESPAEVRAHVSDQTYRYLMTGRADGFIVTLTNSTAGVVDDNYSVKRVLVDSINQDKMVDIYAPLEPPKYEKLLEKLDKNWKISKTGISYEIVLVEAKRLQPPYKENGDGTSGKSGKDGQDFPRSRLKQHLKQVISECAAIKEYGPDKCRILKFILSDGDQWIYGILKNPHTDAIEPRECFYAVVNNPNLDRTEIVIKFLAAWTYGSWPVRRLVVLGIHTILILSRALSGHFMKGIGRRKGGAAVGSKCTSTNLT